VAKRAHILTSKMRGDAARFADQRHMVGEPPCSCTRWMDPRDHDRFFVDVLTDEGGGGGTVQVKSMPMARMLAHLRRAHEDMSDEIRQLQQRARDSDADTDEREDGGVVAQHKLRCDFLNSCFTHADSHGGKIRRKNGTEPVELRWRAVEPPPLGLALDEEEPQCVLCGMRVKVSAAGRQYYFPGLSSTDRGHTGHPQCIAFALTVRPSTTRACLCGIFRGKKGCELAG
jgi:hypothetical protein